MTAEPIPPVPLTLDGSAILHQMFRVRWPAWNAVAAVEQQAMVEGRRPTY